MFCLFSFAFYSILSFFYGGNTYSKIYKGKKVLGTVFGSSKKIRVWDFAYMQVLPRQVKVKLFFIFTFQLYKISKLDILINTNIFF